MNWSEEKLFEALEEAFQALAQNHGSEQIDAIRPIIFTNYERGRVQHFLSGEDAPTPYEYVKKVADCYEEKAAYLSEIQKGSPDVWGQLYLEIYQLAYRYLIKTGFQQETKTFDDAEDCAQLISQELLHAYYPYDTSFKSWLTVITRNICSTFVRKEYGQRPKIQKDLSEPEMEGLLAKVASHPPQEGKDQQERREMLLEAIKQLTPARQKVIWLYYFEGVSFEDIAKDMKKTTSAIYQLHFWAIRDLRKWFKEL